MSQATVAGAGWKNEDGKMRTIYMDNAATTKLDSEVLKAMLPFLKSEYGNPSSMHALGIRAKNAVSASRRRVAEILGCGEEEIIFTGSGTESDNLAVLGYARKRGKGHVITTKIEHHAVLDAVKRLEKGGFGATYLDVDIDGLIDLKQLEAEIRPDTILVSVIYANNEVGTVQDIAAIARLCRKMGVVLHTDACQATNYLDIDVGRLGVDMMTLNGSKIYGPKGVGVLYKNKKYDIEPIVYGGGQEFGLRSGTENVANIVGFSKALEMVQLHKDKETGRVRELRDYLTDGLLKIEETRLNGHRTSRLANNVNVSFLNVEGESLILLLNEDGVCCSTGSACTSASLEPSHVIVALGLAHELGHSSVRFTLGKDTTRQDLDFVIQQTRKHVERLRRISPLKKTMEEVLS